MAEAVKNQSKECLRVVLSLVAGPPPDVALAEVSRQPRAQRRRKEAEAGGAAYREAAPVTLSQDVANLLNAVHRIKF